MQLNYRELLANSLDNGEPLGVCTPLLLVLIITKDLAPPPDAPVCVIRGPDADLCAGWNLFLEYQCLAMQPLADGGAQRRASISGGRDRLDTQAPLP